MWTNHTAHRVGVGEFGSFKLMMTGQPRAASLEVITIGTLLKQTNLCEGD